MSCPNCGSADTRSDHAPARCYALLLLGVGLLFAGRMLKPETVLFPECLPQLLVVGAAALGLGFIDLLRHGNRYCGDCGYRFRRCRGVPVAATNVTAVAEKQAAPPAEGGPEAQPDRRGPGTAARAEAAIERQTASGERAGSEYIRGYGGDDDDTPDPATPLEPIVACLKFKNERMRREAAATLRRLTGQNLGEDHAAWQKWLDENGAEYYASRRRKARQA